MRNLALAFALFAASPLAAQQMCFSRDAVVEGLSGAIAEHVIAEGLTSSGSAIVEVWANPETGTFSVIVTDVYGISCFVTAGQDFRLVPTGEPT